MKVIAPVRKKSNRNLKNPVDQKTVEMKIWRLLYASQKAEKKLAMASSYVCLTISTPSL
jgi:hypothetical protein